MRVNNVLINKAKRSGFVTKVEVMSRQATEQEDYQVKVEDIISRIGDGEDIDFFQKSKILPHWVEEHTAYKSDAWTKLPRLPVTKSQILNVLSCNPSVSNGDDTSEFFDSFGKFSVDYFASNGLSQPIYGTSNFPPGYYYNGKTYIVWGGASCKPYIIAYNHSTGTYTSKVKISDTALTNDDHGVPAVLVDNSGYIHVVWGAHNSALHHVKSTNMEDISAWSALSDIVTKATYQKLVKDSSGNLYVFYRGKNVAEDRPYFSYKKSGDGGATWGAETVVIDFSAAPGYRIYAANVEYDSTNGRMCIAWCHSDLADTWRRNIYYAYLDLSDSKMYSINGDDEGATITKAEADADCLVVNSGVTDTNTPSLHLDSNQYPYIAYNYNGINQRYVYWDGANWSAENTITTRTSVGRHFLIITASDDIIAYLDVDADTEKWTYDGSWSKEKTFSNLRKPTIIKNYQNVARLLIVETDAGDYTNDDLKLYLVDSDEDYVGSDNINNELNKDKWNIEFSPVVDSDNSRVSLSNLCRIVSKTIFGYGYAVHTRCQADEQDSGFVMFSDGIISNNFIELVNSDTDFPNDFDKFKFSSKRAGGLTTHYEDNWDDFRNVWKKYCIKRISGSEAIFEQEDHSYTPTGWNHPTIELGVGFRVWNTSQESTLLGDWIFVRKYTVPEPLITKRKISGKAGIIKSVCGGIAG